jgi:hypothetical protein
MKTHIIENGIIVNTVLSAVEEVLEAFPDYIVADADLTGGVIGDYYENGVVTKKIIESPVITVISMRQARLQLLAMDLLDAVNTQISTMSQAAQIEWEYATEVQRSNPLVSALQTALSMTDSDMDLFFSDALVL